MTSHGSILEKVDTAFSDIISGWSVSSTVIATLLFVFLAYPWLTSKDPDAHPFLLARQATTSPVRQPGESVVLRSTEVPYGYPLRSGLNVKQPGAPKWSSGRNGDLRDIWTQAMRGPTKDDGPHAEPKGKFITVLGREQVLEHSLESVNLEIAMIGKYLQDSRSSHIAICLSNSIELLASIFAATFYGVHPVILPYDMSTDSLIYQLRKVQADVLIAEAGTLQTDKVLSGCEDLAGIILVTKPGNKHMNFTQVPEDVGHDVKISTWQDLVERGKPLGATEVPSLERDMPCPSITLIESRGTSTEGVEYSSEVIVAAVAALISTLPRNQKIRSDDVVLSLAPLTAQYPLMLTFAALFSNATVALNSVSGEEIGFEPAMFGISPTIIIASTSATLEYHKSRREAPQPLLQKLSRHWQLKALRNGTMPTTPSFAAPDQPDFTSNLRILSIYHQAEDTRLPCLSTAALADLKIDLGSRIVYALTTPGVAGAICQTSLFDYRENPERPSHFGPPLSCLELLLKGKEEEVSAIEPQGRIVVRGPSVNGGEVKLDRRAKIATDCTLSLL